MDYDLHQLPNAKESAVTVPIVVTDHDDGERFGNKVFQYALARKIALDTGFTARLEGFKLDILSGLCAHVEPATYERPLFLDKYTCNQDDFTWLRDAYVSGHHDAIFLTGWGTRLSTIVPSTPQLRQELDSLKLDFLPVGESNVLVNIRLAEINRRRPVHVDYSPLPVSYYRQIIREIGKVPIFVGQMTESPYLNRLRRAFPEAQFIDLDPHLAFETIRQAQTKIIAMSTFSWLAAWLGNGQSQIYMPLTGGFNPLQRPDWDFIPWRDSRYRFQWLYPMRRDDVPLKMHLRRQELASLGYPEIRNANPFLRQVRMRSLRAAGTLKITMHS
jgi:hypothetical protein